jgi:hypothetical protein
MALVQGLRGFGQGSATARAAFVYLCASFLVTFALFSATAFQLDYYTVIVYPFAAIMCADFLYKRLQAGASNRLLAAQWAMTLITLGLAWVICLQVAQTSLTAFLGLACLAWLAWVWVMRQAGPTMALLVHPVLAVNLLYLVLEGMTLIAHTRYSIPYNVLSAMANEPVVPVVVYRLDPPVAYELGLYRQTAPVLRIDKPEDLPPPGASYFLLIRTAEAETLSGRTGVMSPLLSGDWVDHKTGTLPRQIELAAGHAPLENFSVYKVMPR